MAFPQVVQFDVQNLEGSQGQSFDIDLPTGITTGNLLVAEIVIGSATRSQPMDLGPGWELVTLEDRFSIDIGFYAKVADVSDGGTTITATVRETGWIDDFASVTIIEVSGWSGTISDIASGGRNTSSGTTLSPASVSVPSADDVLWIAGIAALTSSQPSVTAPAGSTELKNYVNDQGTSQLCYVQASADQIPSDGWLSDTSLSPVRGSIAILPGSVVPTLALDQSEIGLGDTLTGTATNFESAPTTVTLSDGVSPDYAPTPTITADGDNWDFSATVENFAAQAKAAGEGNPIQGLIPGTITVTVE